MMSEFIRPDQLRVDDVMTRVRFSDGQIIDYPYRVTSIGSSASDPNRIAVCGVSTRHDTNTGIMTLCYTDEDVTIEIKPRAIDPNYPLPCTRCGQPAYIGLNRIEHRDRESSCPAR